MCDYDDWKLDSPWNSYSKPRPRIKTKKPIIMITDKYKQEIADIDKQLESNDLTKEERAKLLMDRNEVEICLLNTM